MMRATLRNGVAGATPSRNMREQRALVFRYPARGKHRSCATILIRKQPDYRVLVLFLGSLGQQAGNAFTVQRLEREEFIDASADVLFVDSFCLAGMGRD